MFNLPQISPITTIKPATILKLKIYSTFLFSNNSSRNKFINRKIKILWISSSNHVLALAVEPAHASLALCRPRAGAWPSSHPRGGATCSACTGRWQRPTHSARTGGPRPGRAAAGGVARPAPPALLGAGPDARQSTATARAGGPRPPPACASPGRALDLVLP